MFFALSACNLKHREPDQQESISFYDSSDLSMKVEEVTSSKIKVRFNYVGKEEAIYGNYYILEINKNQSWCSLPYVTDSEVIFNAVGYSLTSKIKSEWETNYKALYGSLQPGQYRIIKSVDVKNSKGSFETYYISVEFSIQ